MKFEREFIEKLKWSVYDWVGAISVTELTSNQNLKVHIESLFKKLSTLNTLEVV
jgi:hypothetical protein